MHRARAGPGYPTRGSTAENRSRVPPRAHLGSSVEADARTRGDSLKLDAAPDEREDMSLDQLWILISASLDDKMQGGLL